VLVTSTSVAAGCERSRYSASPGSGSLADLRANLTALATRYEKDIVVVETAYPWTTEDGEAYPILWNGDTPGSVCRLRVSAVR
jgi:arabinogalactan endo-1,4-beta-galactosidase